MAKAKAVTAAQREYVEKHRETKSVDELAAASGLSKRQVQALAKALDAAPKGPTLGKAGFGEVDGATPVSMTQEAGLLADKQAEANRGRNEEFFRQRVKNGIHVLDPSKPVR